MIEFNDIMCNIRYSTYPNGRISIQLLDAVNGRNVIMATSNIDDVPITVEPTVIVKDSEVLNVLRDAGIVESICSIRIADAFFTLCWLMIEVDITPPSAIL